MLAARLQYYLDSQRLLISEQGGFRPNFTTMHQVMRLTQSIKDSFNRGKSVAALFVDFRGPFDTVWRKKLLNKLKDLGVTGNMFNWIMHFLTQRWVCTKWKSSCLLYTSRCV